MGFPQRHWTHTDLGLTEHSARDIYRPTERATAMGWFMSGTLIGPAIGPFIGGIIVTYTSWRVIFWVQTGLSGMATLGAFFLLPETIHRKKYDDLQGLSKSRKAAVLWDMVNPWKVLKLLLAYPNLYVFTPQMIRTLSRRWSARDTLGCPDGDIHLTDGPS